MISISNKVFGIVYMPVDSQPEMFITDWHLRLFQGLKWERIDSIASD
jgi:hypothetical protein